MTAREVELTGGAPWGFRMHGGVDQNQPLRISRVNPGRKASLSGIREGDVISSINGRPTKGMTNADAHAMLRCAGPVLRLGLNEDREVSPRRRSIGKGSELKRPSQLIAEVQRATPQAPVYATIRRAPSPHNRPAPSAMRSSLNSLPSALNSTPLVKSVASTEEPLRFHPTNPFYTTLPSNYSSASKLPVPNGRASLSGVDRNKSKDTTAYEYSSDLKSPSYFTKAYDSGPSSLPYFHNNAEIMNGYESGASKSTVNDTSEPFTFSSYSQYDKQSLPNENKNPFETKRNSDPFEKYLRPENNMNGKCEYEPKISNSLSDSNFHRNEEVIKRSTITEHKINEVEEVKTIKKIILNGSGGTNDHHNDQNLKFCSPTKNSGINHGDFNSHYSRFKDHNDSSPRNEHIIHVHTPTQHRNDYFGSTFQRKEDHFGTSPSTYPSANEYKLAEAPTSEVVASKPPVREAPAHAPAQPPPASPTPKREYPAQYTTTVTPFYTPKIKPLFQAAMNKSLVTCNLILVCHRKARVE